MLIQADALYLPYPSNYFHAILTSPPYWGLRKYQGDQGEEPLGLETTPERHIERMVEIFREVWRVLRPDGVVWLNYGDCFAGSGGENANTGLTAGKHRYRMTDDKTRSNLYRNNPRKTKIQQGNLMLMPHRLAIALQDDGWIVRNDLVWFKRNPMPESVAGWRWERSRTKKESSERAEGIYNALAYDHPQGAIKDGGIDGSAEYEYGDDYVLRKSSWRHTRAHEYVFMLTKKMQYFCNQEAVREAQDTPLDTKASQTFGAKGGKAKHVYGSKVSGDKWKPSGGRNPRSVLDVPTTPYSGAHYATFPPNLIAPLIRASVPRRCCPECGMAWAPIMTSRPKWEDAPSDYKEYKDKGKEVKTGRGFKGVGGGHKRQAWLDETAPKVIDHRPTCECGHKEHEPGIVLDPFGGSGTTGAVAKQLLRRWVVMDISRPYLDEQAKIRTGSGTPSKALEGLPLFEETE